VSGIFGSIRLLTTYTSQLNCLVITVIIKQFNFDYPLISVMSNETSIMRVGQIQLFFRR